MNGTYCSIGVFAQVSQWRLNSTAVEFENIEQRSPPEGPSCGAKAE